VLSVAVDGASLDTVWVGAPGEPVAAAVQLRITDDAGRPLPGASLAWEALGRNAQVLSPTSESNAAGLATAGWLLGTDALEEQRLQVTVRSSRREGQIVIRARAVPHVVSQLRVALDTPAVLRLGDTLPVSVSAIDPYGNVFPAPDVAVSVVDSAIGSVAGAGVIGGPRRGQSRVRVTTQGIEATFPLQVMQYVATIVPASDVIEFSALGAELPVAYVVRDDRGRVVADTAVAIEVADPTVVQLAGGTVRAIAPGVTSLRLSLASASATVLAGVQQRVGSLRLIRDTIRLDALLDTTTIVPIVHDSLGAPIANPALLYDVSDGEVVRFAAGRTLEALTPGAAIVTVRDSVTGISTSAPVVVQQVITSIEPTSAHISFDALGDTLTLNVTARDRLGSVVPGATFVYTISDSAVVGLDSGAHVRSVAPGHAVVSVRDVETGTVGTVDVTVDQVATTLDVAVAFGQPIVTLPAGASLPLTCEAFDRNGFAIGREPALVGTVRGTITGSGCSDARVERSGYDTLRFAMGMAEARVPVIVSTGDSVAVVAAAQPLTTDERERYVGEDLANPLILALRPLVNDILAAYGNPTSNLDRARAIRDWVARTAIHPHQPFHPNPSTSNLSVLPPGKTWADANAVTSLKFYEDRDYWLSVGYDGYAMLDRLLGTLDPVSGSRADDGMMVQVAGARYRIRDVASYRYVLCTFQDIMLNALWAAAGLQGMLISTLDHDPAAVFIPEFGRWVYEDPTYNEEYLLDGVGDPLSPIDLLTLSEGGNAYRLQSTKGPGPTFDPQVYITGLTYFSNGHADGMVIMGSQLNNRVVGIGGWPSRQVQIDVPELAAYWPFNQPLAYPPVTAAVAFPTLGPIVDDVHIEDSVYVVRLSSTFPNHQHFERRLEGQDWQGVSDADVLPVGACRVEYRGVDAVGSVSASTVLDVWAPRADGFVEFGLPGSVRQQAGYCTPIPRVSP
jgi:hypothetical protein